MERDSIGIPFSDRIIQTPSSFDPHLAVERDSRLSRYRDYSKFLQEVERNFPDNAAIPFITIPFTLATGIATGEVTANTANELSTPSYKKTILGSLTNLLDGIQLMAEYDLVWKGPYEKRLSNNQKLISHMSFLEGDTELMICRRKNQSENLDSLEIKYFDVNIGHARRKDMRRKTYSTTFSLEYRDDKTQLQCGVYVHEYSWRKGVSTDSKSVMVLDNSLPAQLISYNFFGDSRTKIPLFTGGVDEIERKRDEVVAFLGLEKIFYVDPNKSYPRIETNSRSQK